jgi:hypothetical protein
MARNKNKKRVFVRATQPVILIVCEGEVVERAYFRQLKNEFKGLPVNIEIKTKKEIGGNTPDRIVKYVAKLCKGKEFQYDHIFCVFDKDSHSSYQQAIKEIEDLNNRSKRSIVAIHSAPCFEYWFLLHFEYTASPFSSTPSKSTADHCVQRLKRHVPKYDKKKELILEIFPNLFARIETAIKNAKKIQIASKKDGFDEPFTNVNVVVEYFRKISKKNQE